MSRSLHHSIASIASIVTSSIRSLFQSKAHSPPPCRKSRIIKHFHRPPYQEFSTSWRKGCSSGLYPSIARFSIASPLRVGRYHPSPFAFDGISRSTRWTLTQGDCRISQPSSHRLPSFHWGISAMAETIFGTHSSDPNSEWAQFDFGQQQLRAYPAPDLDFQTSNPITNYQQPAYADYTVNNHAVQYDGHGQAIFQQPAGTDAENAQPRLTQDQIAALENTFVEAPKPKMEHKKNLAERLGLELPRVNVIEAPSTHSHLEPNTIS